ncbi:MAG TPA: tagatose 1,6-diphosphate aldolase [Anaerolineales bacterium]|nr:tagatose 1,6-diphosphate aldolase [Anaerolineales bacterium]
MISPTLSLGKARALQQSSTANGVFTILAADHRDTMRSMIDSARPQDVSPQTLTDIKLDIVRSLSDLSSAVLLDPIYSAAQVIAGGALAGHAGLLVALEDQGYLGDPYNRETTSLSGWSVEKARRLGATGVKVLLFYHPDAGAAAEKQEKYTQAVIADCGHRELPLFLEPISYPLSPEVKKDSPEFASERRRVVIQSARRLGALGADVLKLEFPVDAAYHPDLALWADACAELNDASPAPWILLSAGEPFETFCQQLTIACQSGCAGFAVGRSVWNEAAKLPIEERAHFLSTTARERFKRLVEIAQAFAHSWQERYTLPMPDENWYRTY